MQMTPRKRDTRKKRPDGETRALVLELTKVQQLTPQDIARALGVTTQAVYTHLQRLREAGEFDEVAS